MPNRILKESICTSETTNSLSWFEEVFFYRLIVSCDDYGRFDARILVLKSRLFPLKPKLSNADVSKCLQSLADVGLIELYESGGKPYLHVTKWENHQSIRAKRSKYPEPEIICKQLHTDASICSRNPIQSESNPNPNPIRECAKAPHAIFEKPTIEEVRAYCAERNNAVNPERWLSYYESNGWMVGRNKMKDWKAAIRTWEANERGQGRPSGSTDNRGDAQGSGGKIGSDDDGYHLQVIRC